VYAERANMETDGMTYTPVMVRRWHVPSCSLLGS
jgi:hypothetical protein